MREVRAKSFELRSSLVDFLPISWNGRSDVCLVCKARTDSRRAETASLRLRTSRRRSAWPRELIRNLQLKAICVPILSLARAPPSPASTNELILLLDRLAQHLEAIPRIVFSPALANYVFFPLSSLLQPATTGQDHGDRVLESTMVALEVLVRKWRTCEGGIEARVLTELWIMSVLLLGGPLDVNAPGKAGKGKSKALSEEVEYRVLKVVRTIMLPVATLVEEEVAATAGEDEEDDDDLLGQDIDWSVDEPSPETLKPKPTFALPFVPTSILASPPLPILFHTLTTLLFLSTRPSALPALQITSLVTLSTLIESYLVPHPPPTKSFALPASSPSGPSPYIATALPGAASALSRIILSAPSKSDSTTINPDQAKRQSTPAIVAALQVLQLLIESTLSDDLTKELRTTVEESGEEATLEELVESYQETTTPVDETEAMPLEETESILSSATPIPAGPTRPTAAWLRHTVEKISLLITALSPLTSHPSAPVRIALTRFSSTLLDRCSKTLGSTTLRLVEGLLVLSGDSWPDVALPAKSSLLKILAGNDRIDYTKMTLDIIKMRLVELPRSLLRGDEKTVSTSSKVVIAGLEIISVTASIAGAGAGPLSEIERWSWSLLRALTFSRVVGAGSGSQSGASRAWITGATPVKSDSTAAWPTFAMSHVREESTRKGLESLWESLGLWSQRIGKENEIVGQFLGIAVGVKGAEGVGPSALWVLDGVLRGLSPEHGKNRRKKMIRNVVQSILELLQSLEQDSPPVDTPIPSSINQELMDSSAEAALSISVEHRRGAVSLTPTLDSLAPVATSHSDSQASHRVLAVSLSLRILSTCAELLSSSFQPHLLQVLYHVLAHLSPVSHPLLREHAEIALARIAYSTSYASPENLILANVDYVVNSVSQRLTLLKLDPAAPLVLVEMIRLVGEPIIPMVQDLVDDVFEALDDFHGYEEVTMGLWAVLDALTRVMVGEVDEVVPVRRELELIEVDSEKDWTSFVDWFQQRDIELVEEGGGPGPHPQAPFATTLPPDEDVPEPAQREEIKPPPTRPQAVQAQILSKALFFLSHSSPFLRSRVLSLISSAVPLLVSPSSPDDPNSTRESDLLPIVHRSWPYILNRFLDKEPYVVLEACSLVESLAKNVGSFMSKRVLEDVWPKFKLLLARQEKEDLHFNALAGNTKFTVSHKIYCSILRTLRVVIRDVQMKEAVVWEMAISLRRFLDRTLEKEICELAREVYRALEVVSPDIVWLVLQGALGAEGLPEYLKLAGDLRDNVETILGN